VLKLPLLDAHQQKVGEVVLSKNFLPFYHFRKYFKSVYRKMWLW
jgi:hypothetical protein